MNELAKRALREYNSEVTTAHHGGKDGRPFWNTHASQFMFNPNFQFSELPGCNNYLFTATDCNKKKHVFKAEEPTALLTPIWGDIPEGVVELKVEALNDDDEPIALVGARTFFRLAPFAGAESYPPKARGYRECALMAYRYVFERPFIQYWRLHGSPDPDFDFNVYPSKTISSVIKAMINYAKLDPDKAEESMDIAVKAADFLISISFPEDSALPGLPPTYYTDFRKDLDKYNNESAIVRGGNVMMIYPADVGNAYLLLEKATGEVRFFEAAKKIAEFYRANVSENGSWHLFVSTEDGKPQNANYCVPSHIMTFMNRMHLRTGEEVWAKLEQGCYYYIVRNCFEQYNWEGQFEDSAFSTLYSNLTHFTAEEMIRYITENKADDEKLMAEAEDLMRFVEDQFVVWGNFAPWNHVDSPRHGNDISQWFSPAGLEQYKWYVPIDSSTATIIEAFLDLYSVKKDPLLLAKACVLGDSITRMQNPETGLIPTHWMRSSCIEDGGNLWINCMIRTAMSMMYLADVTEGK